VIPRLCYITDGARGTGGRPLVEVLPRLARGGTGMVILRERDPSPDAFASWVDILQPFRAHGLRLLVSRRLDLARAFALDGVHLAADAVPVAEARAWLGTDTFIGYSAHSNEEARRVEQEGASYVTLSPVYPTGSKPGAPGRGAGWLADAARGLRIPVLALGGVSPARVDELLHAGAHGVAAVSALGAAPDVEASARAFTQAILEASE
jgi:thiamine-phosphate pyrophosphorylase